MVISDVHVAYREIRGVPEVFKHICSNPTLVSACLVMKVHCSRLGIQFILVFDKRFDGGHGRECRHTKFAIESTADVWKPLILLLGAVPDYNHVSYWRPPSMTDTYHSIDAHLQLSDLMTSCLPPWMENMASTSFLELPWRLSPVRGVRRCSELGNLTWSSPLDCHCPDNPGRTAPESGSLHLCLRKWRY